MQEYRQFTWMSTVPNYSYINGAMLAKYLAGTNSAGVAIPSWPAFQGSSASNFRQKYSLRQIDSIVAQIVASVQKLISSDYPHPSSSDYPAAMNISDGSGDGWLSLYMERTRGLRYNNAPFLFPGWLSGQFVSGMGRTAKLGLENEGQCLRILWNRGRYELRSAFGLYGHMAGVVASVSLSWRQPYSELRRCSSDTVNTIEGR